MAQKQFKIGLSNTDKQNMAQDVYERVLALTFAEYDSAETYNEGDFVVYNDLLYKCLADNVTGTWDATKWQQATLQDLLDDVEGAVASVDGKANVDGNYPTMTVGMADNLTPYDESAGDDQDEPFILQATGTGNGSQPDFSTGSAGLMKEKQGNTVVVNQQVKNGNFSVSAYWSISGGSLSISGGKARASANDGATLVEFYQGGLNFIKYHKYLRMVTVKSSVQLDSIQLGGIGEKTTLDTNTIGGTYFIIKTASANQQYFDLYLYKATFASGDYIDISNCYDIDLTQWFNGDIPQDLLDNPSNFFRYYQGSLAYNEGTLVNANGRYIKCIGMNQWDEEWELGQINPSTGENIVNSQTIRSKNYVKVIPNADCRMVFSATTGYVLYFYDAQKNFIGYQDKGGTKSFTTPANCCYLRFVFYSTYGTTYNNDISINLYYEDEPRCLTYEPYQVLTNNDTGTEVLRKAGNVCDIKLPDGTIKRNVGYVDLGTLTWTYHAASGNYGDFFDCYLPNDCKVGESATVSNIICGKGYQAIESGNIAEIGYRDKVMAIAQATTRFIVCDTSYTDAATFKTAMNGVYLFYELATPTTEQGTPYSENLVIDDFGSMDFGGTNGVPQGALIFYPVDYKAFVDTLYKYSDGTPSDLAKNSELNTKFESYLKSLSGYDASATQVLKNVEGTFTWVTEGE